AGSMTRPDINPWSLRIDGRASAAGLRRHHRIPVHRIPPPASGRVYDPPLRAALESNGRVDDPA
ncbi:MAG: hypothetical protein ABJC74_07130, partial [Gemmatimonadota bacterium]